METGGSQGLNGQPGHPSHRTPGLHERPCLKTWWKQLRKTPSVNLWSRLHLHTRAHTHKASICLLHLGGDTSFKIPPSSTHFPTNAIALFFPATHSSVVSMYGTIQSSVDRHLARLRFLTIVNRTAMNTDMHVPLWEDSDSWVKSRGVQLVGTVVVF